MNHVKWVSRQYERAKAKTAYATLEDLDFRGKERADARKRVGRFLKKYPQFKGRVF